MAVSGRPKNQRGNKDAAKPGSLYSQFLTNEETIAAAWSWAAWMKSFRLTRIRLMRALQLEQSVRDTLELVDPSGAPAKAILPGDEEKKRKVKDYAGLIDKLTGRIESLELRRVQILAIQADTT
jgi:hypothetical protein